MNTNTSCTDHPVARIYLERYPENSFTAYVRFQSALMTRFQVKGGNADEWCQRLAPVFADRFRWMIAERGFRNAA